MNKFKYIFYIDYIKCPSGCSEACTPLHYDSACREKCNCTPCHHIYGCNQTLVMEGMTAHSLKELWNLKETNNVGLMFVGLMFVYHCKR